MSIFAYDQDCKLGTTSQIRKKLNFHDEVIWKNFSSRRLKLIDSMGLSAKKACEQEREIQECAFTLLKEFEYPSECLNDFIRLVRIAIQSVRRNRKRCSKSRLNNNDRFVIINGSKDNKDNNSSSSDHDHDNDNDKDNSLDKVKLGFNISEILHDDANDGNNNNNKNKDLKDELNSKLAVKALIQPILPNTGASIGVKLPSFATLLNTNDYQYQSSSVRTLSNKELISLNKLLSLIKKSKTCNQISNEINTSIFEKSESLGSLVINSTISLTLLKNFGNLNHSSAKYLLLKLSSDSTMSKILKNLDSESTEVITLDVFMASQSFKRLIGCCIIDFGFDCITIPLGDIFNEIILKEYPLISKNQSANNNVNSSLPIQISNGNDLYDSMKIDNLISTSNYNIRQEIQQNEKNFNDLPSDKKVILKYHNQSLFFKFNSKISSSPTHLELLENCKEAFQIVDKNKFLIIKANNSKKILNNDDELQKIFNDDNNKLIELEISTASNNGKDFSTQSRGLNINSNDSIKSKNYTATSGERSTLSKFSKFSKFSTCVSPDEAKQKKRKTETNSDNGENDKEQIIGIQFQPLL
ncbi:hypothetical protein PACTADRAFT_14146 [Pachysolen tannophilus NRRL Y-2460]|uniref:Uncharacterized protein n=1 Tax=Pachysolen tannophilus NRRL Y-2460 TaxID=669874 RepID=A0A1E4U0U9_PACTA|nr:hypothetical protein PACTADRAFT_14146 [Pachysolen tannophilus NRRL Y-2460]